MSIAIITSFVRQFLDTGEVNNGGSVTVYEAGTTTPMDLFSDPDLDPGHAALNPVTLNSAGRHAIRYIEAGTSYKLVIKDSDSNTVETIDNIDPGVAVGSGALPVPAGGTGATSAGVARTNLGVPSQSELDDVTTDLTALQTQVSSISSAPQGYLTLSSGVPVITGDVTGAATVYYTPFVGAQIPIYDDTAFSITTFSELSLGLVANHVAHAIYDCFVINDSGTVRLVTGPAWNTATPGSGARGSGAGTTELERVTGIWVNKNAFTGRYGSTTVSVDAREGTYVGSIWIDTTAGQVSCHRGYGQNRKWGVWNAYNRVPIQLKAGDGTGNWTYATASIRASNNVPASYTANSYNVGSGTAVNGLTVFSGLAEESYDIMFEQAKETGAGSQIIHGIGVNSISAFSGLGAYMHGTTDGYLQTQSARYIAPPSLGLQNITALEFGAANSSFDGTELNMLLSARWRG